MLNHITTHFAAMESDAENSVAIDEGMLDFLEKSKEFNEINETLTRVEEAQATLESLHEFIKSDQAKNLDERNIQLIGIALESHSALLSEIFGKKILPSYETLCQEMNKQQFVEKQIDYALEGIIQGISNAVHKTIKSFADTIASALNLTSSLTNGTYELQDAIRRKSKVRRSDVMKVKDANTLHFSGSVEPKAIIKGFTNSNDVCQAVIDGYAPAIIEGYKYLLKQANDRHFGIFNPISTMIEQAEGAGVIAREFNKNVETALRALPRDVEISGGLVFANKTALGVIGDSMLTAFMLTTGGVLVSTNLFYKKERRTLDWSKPASVPSLDEIKKVLDLIIEGTDIIENRWKGILDAVKDIHEGFNQARDESAAGRAIGLVQWVNRVGLELKALNQHHLLLAPVQHAYGQTTTVCRSAYYYCEAATKLYVDKE